MTKLKLISCTGKIQEDIEIEENFDIGHLKFSLNTFALDKRLSDLIYQFLYNHYGIPHTKKKMSEHIGINIKDVSNLSIRLPFKLSAEIDFKANELLDDAIDYFNENLTNVIEESMNILILESLTKTLQKNDSESYFINGTSQIVAANKLSDISNKLRRRRLKPKKNSGRKSLFTPEEEDIMLLKYDTLLITLDKAKEEYKKIKDYSAWEEMMHTKFPSLPIEYIRLFSLKGMSEPNFIAAKMIATEHSVSIDYLPKILSRARKIRKAKK